MQTTDIDRQDEELRELLRDYPAPQPEAGFYDRALLRATHEGSKRQRNRWVMTGFASAVAAGLVLWFVSGLLLAPQATGPASNDIPGITMTLEEPRKVNLVFASATPLERATLTVTLPDGIELAGFPGRREVTWQTSLAAGKNLLPLELVAVSPGGGEILARLKHEDRDRSFRLRVAVG